MCAVTTEDLLRYLYGEMTDSEAVTVREALDASWPLREKFAVLQEAHDRLDRARLPGPSQRVLDMVFLHALLPAEAGRE